MQLETERLRLRPWTLTDAERLYEYAKDPDIGPAAGWPAHRSVEESREVICTVFCEAECYALCLRGDDRPIGAAALKRRSALAPGEDECELGYWVGKPHWGQGLMPEACRALLRRAFAELGLQRVWCGYYAGNEKSRRVQEKCGFRYIRTQEVFVEALGETRTERVSCLTREEWLRL